MIQPEIEVDAAAGEELEHLEAQLDALEEKRSKIRLIFYNSFLMGLLPVVVLGVFLMTIRDYTGYIIPELFSFGAVLVLFAPLVWGGIVIIFSHELKKRTASLEESIAREKGEVLDGG